jgi:hypothetical protein
MPVFTIAGAADDPGVPGVDEPVTGEKADIAAPDRHVPAYIYTGFTDIFSEPDFPAAVTERHASRAYTNRYLHFDCPNKRYPSCGFARAFGSLRRTLANG